MTSNFKVPDGWQAILRPALETHNAQQLAAFFQEEKRAGKRIFPPEDLRFHALKLVRPDQVHVVILGQDPYHGEGQAHGLSFSVPDGIRPPPSLRNMFKELERDLQIKAPQSGNLERWAAQGVLLLNTVITVEEAKAGSHQGKGWEAITDAIIRHVGNQANPSVVMLWGSHAQKKKQLIDTAQHLVLEAPHPSPLSAHRGFLGCGHFSVANEWLKSKDRQPIVW